MKRSIPFSTGLATAALLNLSAHANIIFQASDTNTTEVVNTSNDLDELTITGDTNGGTLLVNNENGNFNNGGTTSTDTITTLNGGALTAADTVTMTLTVDAITGGFRANGVTFGLTDDNATFGLGAGGLGVNVRPNNATTTLAAGFGTTDPITVWGATEASIKDGFTITFTATENGYRFSFTGLTSMNANPIVDITGSFSGTEFVDNFGPGFLYQTTQKFNLGTDATDTTISVASIDVSDIPDLDGDGMPDSYEDTTPGLDRSFAGDADQGANDGLFDNDGRTNLEEFLTGTDPNIADVDMDDLNDGEEFMAGTDPFVADSDGDMLNDGVEVNGDMNPFQVGHITGTTPGGIPGEGTDPLVADTDGDSLSDFEELDASNGSVTNPNSPDSDGDGVKDAIEIAASSLPNDATSTPVFPSISWSAQALDEEADLSTSGTLLFADNFQGPDVTVNGIPFVGRLATNSTVDLSSPQLQTQLRTTSVGINVTDIYDDEVPALTPLLDTLWFQGGGTEVTNYSLTGLTPGMSYLVEIGRSDDRGGSIVDRSVRADNFGGGVETDPIGATNLTYGGPGNPAILVSGTFTAAHSVQTFRWEQYLADDSLSGSNIQFIQVREVDLPTDIQVCDIRNLGATVEVDFAGLDPNRSYQLVRSSDLQDGFPTIVDGPRVPAAGADTFTDPSPLATEAFYQLEELAAP